MTATPADQALIERLLRETGASSTPPAPEWSEYARELAGEVAAWLEALLAPVARGLGARVQWLEYGAAALVIVTLAVLLFLLGRALLESARRRQPGAAAGPTPAPSPGPEPARAPADWRAEVDARLARGDVKAALAALWWWLASAVSTRDADPTWTSRELLEQARRRDLQPFARDLDRQAYGPVRPGVDEVRRLAARLEGALR